MIVICLFFIRFSILNKIILFKIAVILLARMWVEKVFLVLSINVMKSSSLWGCELKSWQVNPYGTTGRSSSLWGCELKCYHSISTKSVVWSSSLWGCELKGNRNWIWRNGCGHPPCEDVSWKIHINVKSRSRCKLSSSRGSELKFYQRKLLNHRWSSSSSWGCELKNGIYLP